MGSLFWQEQKRKFATKISRKQNGHFEIINHSGSDPHLRGSELWETSWIRIRIEDADLNLGVKKTEYLSKEQKVSI